MFPVQSNNYKFKTRDRDEAPKCKIEEYEPKEETIGSKLNKSLTTEKQIKRNSYVHEIMNIH